MIPFPWWELSLKPCVHTVIHSVCTATLLHSELVAALLTLHRVWLLHTLLCFPVYCFPLFCWHCRCVQIHVSWYQHKNSHVYSWLLPYPGTTSQRVFPVRTCVTRTNDLSLQTSSGVRMRKQLLCVFLLYIRDEQCDVVNQLPCKVEWFRQQDCLPRPHVTCWLTGWQLVAMIHLCWISVALIWTWKLPFWKKKLVLLFRTLKVLSCVKQLFLFKVLNKRRN